MTGDFQARNPPLLGRRRERDLLNALLDEAMSGAGRLLLVSGEAGIGKTALVSEMTCNAVASDALVLTGACFDLTTTPPYGPWVEIAREYQDVCDAPNSSGGLPPLPDGLLDAGNGPRSRNALFDNTGHFFRALATVQPLVIVLEDLHWADPASVDLLRVIARQRGGKRPLIAVTYRGDELDRGSRLHQLLPLLVRESGAQRLDLRPLEPSAVAALVSASYPTNEPDHPRLVEYLTQRAEGNPFYTWELLRGLESEGLLTRSPDGWAVGHLEDLRVPALLGQVIDMRLARLEEGIERRLAVASVIGQEVPFELWQAVLGLSVDEVVGTVETAGVAQITDATPDGRGVRFRHALFRDAVYQSIPPPRRRALHREIGERLAMSPAPDPDAVAWHFGAASDERAATWLIKAGERAQRAYAWTTAAERLSEADRRLPATTTSQERGWLRYRIGRLRRHANSQEAIAALREAEQLGRWSRDPTLTAYARFDLGHARVIAGDYRQGIEQMIAGDELLDTLPPDHAPAGSEIAAWVADTLPARGALPASQKTTAVPINPRHGTLIQWMFEPGRLRETRALGEAYAGAIDVEAEHDEQLISSAGDAWFGLGRVYAAYGDPDRALEAMARATDCYRRIDHHLLTSSTLRLTLAEIILPYLTTDRSLRQTMAGAAVEAYRRAAGALGSDRANQHVILETLIHEGEWTEARAVLAALLAQPEIMAAWRVRGLAALGRLAREQGEPDLALAQVEAVLPEGPATEPGHTSFMQAIALQLLAVDLALDQADLDQAAGWLESLTRWLDWASAIRWLPEAALALARLHIAAGDPAAAHASGLEALRLAESPRQPLAILTAHRTLGEIELQRGNHEASNEHLTQALRLAEQCGAPYELALTQLAITQLRLESGDFTASEAMLSAAREALQRLGALPALERADHLAARIKVETAPTQPPFGLSPRELEVLQLVADGLTDAEIAGRLFISYRTVTTHLSSIFNKLGVNSRVSATRLAVERGIV